MAQSNLSPQARAVLAGAMVGGGAALLAGAAASGVAAYFARRVLRPAATKPDDVQILRVTAETVTLGRNADTEAPGNYGLWLQGGSGYARIGEIVSRDDDGVTRTLLGVDRGVLEPGPARWSNFHFTGDPGALGLAFENVRISSDLGELPTWFVPAPSPARTTWAILVHGYGVTREECLRAVPMLHRLGLPVLIPSYRNDDGAPSAGGSSLGDAEWRDIEAAVLHALDHGATEVVLFGWSMGGAVVLQLVHRSWLADRVKALVLDSPVIDWNDVLEHHASLNRVPRPVGELTRTMLRDHHWRRLSGLGGAPVDLHRLDWVTRADELRLPVLLLHSDDDEFVPSGPSRRLARARPDLVTFESFPQARHCSEWNTDPERWEREIVRFLLRYL